MGAHAINSPGEVRRLGITEVTAQIQAQHPSWPADRCLADAKIKWYAEIEPQLQRPAMLRENVE